MRQSSKKNKFSSANYIYIFFIIQWKTQLGKFYFNQNVKVLREKRENNKKKIKNEYSWEKNKAKFPTLSVK